DPTRNAVASTVPVGDAPTAVAAGADGVWVTDEGAGALVSVDPRTGTVRRRDTVGAAPATVTLLGQTPWVAAGAPAGREHRGGTLRVEYSAIQVFDPADPNNVHPAIWRATGDGLVALAQASGAANSSGCTPRTARAPSSTRPCKERRHARSGPLPATCHAGSSPTTGPAP